MFSFSPSFLLLLLLLIFFLCGSCHAREHNTHQDFYSLIPSLTQLHLPPPSPPPCSGLYFSNFFSTLSPFSMCVSIETTTTTPLEKWKWCANYLLSAPLGCIVQCLRLITPFLSLHCCFFLTSLFSSFLFVHIFFSLCCCCCCFFCCCFCWTLEHCNGAIFFFVFKRKERSKKKKKKRERRRRRRRKRRKGCAGVACFTF